MREARSLVLLEMRLLAFYKSPGTPESRRAISGLSNGDATSRIQYNYM
jgi:hypothetical protein